jgi:hypothetical protein
MTSLVQAQWADIAFHYHPESASAETNGYLRSTFKSASTPEMAPPVIYTQLAPASMALHDFRRFGIYDALLDVLKEECVTVHSYRLVRESLRFDPEIHASYGGRIDDGSLRMVRNARDGDRYILCDVQVKNAEGIIYRIPLVATAIIRKPEL